MDAVTACSRCGYSAALDIPDHNTLIPEPDDRIQYLLASNERPRHHEENIIRGQVTQAEDSLTQYDASIDRLERELTRLRARRDSLQELTTARKAILSPIRRLPSELISEIAYHAIPDVEESVSLKLREGPWVLSHLCSRWRDTVVSLPGLWSQPKICPADINYNPMSPIILDTILTRAKDHRLTFKSVYFDPRFPDMHMYRRILEVMVSRSHLWHNVTMFDFPTELIPVLDAVRNRLPLLNWLWVRFDSDSDVAATTPIDYFANAPLFVHASFHHFPGDLRLLQLPWSQLTRLEAYDCTAEEELYILRQLRSIRSCDLRRTAEDPLDLEVFDSIELPFLQRLSADTLHTLGCVLAPSLVAVDITVDGFNVDPFISLINRSSCTLQYLWLSAIMGEPDDESGGVEDAVTILDAVPTISSLRIYVTTYNPSLISRLTLAPDHPSCILPKLESLSLSFTTEFMEAGAIDFNLLVQMVKSRLDPQSVGHSSVSRLKKFHFEINLHRPGAGIDIIGLSEAYATFVAWRDDGMDIFINLQSDLGPVEFEFESALGMHN